MSDETWLFRLRSVLAKHGLFIEHDPIAGGTRDGFLVRGGTFQLEQVLTDVGGVWDGNASVWKLASHLQLAKLVAALEPEAPSETVVYETPARGTKSWGLREEYGQSSAVGNRDRAGRRVDRRTRQLAELPPEGLPHEEVLEVMLALGTSCPDPQRLAERLLERFQSLGAVLGAEPNLYAECLLPDDRVTPSPHPAVQANERHWELATLLKTAQELFQRVLKEEIKDRPVIGSWTALMDYLSLAMQHKTTEHFRILFLDRKNLLIRDEVQSRGTVDHTPLYPREVAKRALELAASAIIMVHNHPSGDPTPSQADIEMTRQVVAALDFFGIAVHDHIIVGKNRYTSFRTQKLL